MKPIKTIPIEIGEEFSSTNGKVKLPGAKAGTWKYSMVKSSQIYLHGDLDLGTATNLSKWESTEVDSVKVTRDREGLIIGVAILRR